MQAVFGQRLKQPRISRGMSQEELALKLSTTKQVISRYENGQRTPKITVALDFASRLGVPLEYLFDKEDSISVPGSGKVQEASELFAQLTDEEQRMMLAQMRGVLSSRKDDSK